MFAICCGNGGRGDGWESVVAVVVKQDHHD